MKAGCTVILESTVYPGVTEEVVKPILEKSADSIDGSISTQIPRPSTATNSCHPGHP